MFKKFFLDFLYSQYNRVFAGQKNYHDRIKKNYSLQYIKLTNTLLAKDLEKQSTSHGGFLSFADYLTTEQYGMHGYHSHASHHGETGIHFRWPKALASLLAQHAIKDIIEFGPGDGSLAATTMREAHKLHLFPSWTGIEINSQLQEKIRKRFKKEKVKNSFQVVPSLKQVPFQNQKLVIFPYSLDSLAPEILINTTASIAFPNKLIGVTVQNSMLKEIPLDQLSQLSLAKGKVYTTEGLSFDFSSWKLYPGQRIYAPIQAFSTLYSITKKVPKGSIIVIIDEFRPPPQPQERDHFGLLRDLHLFKRDAFDLEKAYKTAGDNLWYHPFYFVDYYSFLNQLGFNQIIFDKEQKLARILAGDSWTTKNRFYLTYALITDSKKKDPPKHFTIPFPSQGDNIPKPDHP